MTDLNRHRFRVIEAAVLMLAARTLVHTFPFSLWRSLLGRPLAEADVAVPAPDRLAGLCAGAIERAAARLPGTICLPQAMALHWMLRRRGLSSALLIGIRAQSSQAPQPDMLHAWILHGGSTLLGGAGENHQPVLRLG